MSTYSSKPVTGPVAAATLADKFSDFTALQEKIDALSDEQRAAVGDVSFTPDTIVLNTPQIGKVTLEAVERTPERLVLKAQGTPVPLFLKVNLTPADAGDSTEVVGSIDVDLPIMLKPMVGPMLQKFADKFGSLFASFA